MWTKFSFVSGKKWWQIFASLLYILNSIQNLYQPILWSFLTQPSARIFIIMIKTFKSKISHRGRVPAVKRLQWRKSLVLDLVLTWLLQLMDSFGPVVPSFDQLTICVFGPLWKTKILNKELVHSLPSQFTSAVISSNWYLTSKKFASACRRRIYCKRHLFTLTRIFCVVLSVTGVWYEADQVKISTFPRQPVRSEWSAHRILVWGNAARPQGWVIPPRLLSVRLQICAHVEVQVHRWLWSELVAISVS